MVEVKKANLLESVDASRVNIKRDGYFRRAYIVDLALDSHPDHVWQDIFEREWRTSMHLWDRKLFIMGDTLRLVTTPDNMAEKLNWIREIVSSTNRRVETFNKQTSSLLDDHPETHKAMVQHDETVESIRQALRKSFGQK